MARNGHARPHGDKAKVVKLIRLGHLSYSEIASKTGMPLGTVCRYAAEARAADEVPARRTGTVNIREVSDGGPITWRS